MSRFNLYKYVCALPALLFLAGCRKDIDLESLRPAPAVVINCVVSPDEPVRAAVYRTLFLTDAKPEANAAIEDAKVKLVVNDTLTFDMPRDGVKSYYEAKYTPRPGDRVKVVADTRYGTAEGTDRVPRLVPVREVKVSYVKLAAAKDAGYAHGDRECRYHITFDDPAGEHNYYFIRILDAYDRSVKLDYSVDEVFSGLFDGLNGLDEGSAINGIEGVAFADHLFDGRRYTLKVSELFGGEPESEYAHKPRRTVQLYSVSESYYRYLSGIFNEDDASLNKSLEKIGLSEPTRVYSNVVGGTGIVGAMQISRGAYRLAATSDDRKIELRPYVPGDSVDDPSVWRPYVVRRR